MVKETELTDVIYFISINYAAHLLISKTRVKHEKGVLSNLVLEDKYLNLFCLKIHFS